MDTEFETSAQSSPKGRFDWLHILLFVIVAATVAAGVTYWLIKAYIFPSEFKPVILSGREEQVLNAKLERLESLDTVRGAVRGGTKPERIDGPDGALIEPEPYSEEGASREIILSEKELNALLAKNTDLARKLAIDLSGNLVSAKLLVPVDEDFPILGGKILKVRAGVELAYSGGKPIVALRGISVMGVPLPNAWLGGIKNIDLVKEYGAEQGFWKSFSEGVEDIHVEEGRLKIKLKE